MSDFRKLGFSGNSAKSEFSADDPSFERRESQSTPAEPEEALPSKEEILVEMDELDVDIAQTESRLQLLRKSKLESERPKERRNLTLVDRILLENQEKAEQTSQPLSEYAALEKPPGSFKEPRDLAIFHANRKKHIQQRPKMLYFLFQKLHERKVQERSLAEKYCSLKDRWLRRLRKNEQQRRSINSSDDGSESSKVTDDEKTVSSSSITSSTSVTISTSLTFTDKTTSRRGSNRSTRNTRILSDAVNSEEEFSQIIQQLREQDNQVSIFFIHYNEALQKLIYFD
jgi:hypothetical protein